MMGIHTTKAKPLAEAALNGRAQRQEMISSNLANINTPFYKARDIRFEDALIERTKEMYSNEKSKMLQIAKTHGEHLEPIKDIDPMKSTVFFRDGHMAKNDGNTVDLDIETSEMGKNSVMFKALMSATKKQSDIFKLMLDSSAKS